MKVIIIHFENNIADLTINFKYYKPDESGLEDKSEVSEVPDNKSEDKILDELIKKYLSLHNIKYTSNKIGKFYYIRNVVFSNDITDMLLFNQILTKTDININELFEIVKKCSEYFTNYEVNNWIENFINMHILTYGSHNNFWKSMASKPDYNLCLFQKRTFPYFNVESKEWKKVNEEAVNNEYPSALFISNKKSEDDFNDEILIATKHNNFLEWQILEINQYPNMEKLVNKIKLLYKLKLEKQAITLFLRLLLSPKECHIFKEVEIWKLIKPLLYKNKDLDEIVRYCSSYAMYILRQEETIMFSKVESDKYRVIFTLEEACELPTFNNVHIERNPYILQLTGETELSKSIPFYLQGKRSINNMDEFKTRFNIATGNIFKDINLKELNASITGSILIPCVSKSPLEDNYKNLTVVRNRSKCTTPLNNMIDPLTSEDEINFYNYLEEFYPSYVSLVDKDFMEQVLNEDKKLKSIVKKNLYDDDNDQSYIQNNIEPTLSKMGEVFKYTDEDESSINLDGLANDLLNVDDNEDQDEKTALLDEKTALLDEKKLSADKKTNLVKAKKLNKNLDKDLKDLTTIHNPNQINKSDIKIDYNLLADIDISITAPNHIVFKKNAYIMYEKIKENAKHRGPVYITEVKTIASIKYHLSGLGLSRPIDIFRIPYGPEKMVKKFHINAVKMYYDGEVKLFRSCVSSLLSGVGENYKWFSCNKIPMDVVLKYAQRGLSVILNECEKNVVSNFITKTERWNNIITTNNINPNKIYTIINKNNCFFNTGNCNGGIRMGLRNFKYDIPIYNNETVCEKQVSLMPYGELIFKTNSIIYPPVIHVINDYFEYIVNQNTNEKYISE